MKTTHYVLFALSIFLSACQSTPTGRHDIPVPPRPIGPVTAFPDVELFGENPLTAFQRTGNAPLPVGSLPVGTRLSILARSGAYYHVATDGMGTGWVAANSVSGVQGPVPDFVAPAPDPLIPAVPPPGGTAMPLPTGNQPDTIDLDNMP